MHFPITSDPIVLKSVILLLKASKRPHKTDIFKFGTSVTYIYIDLHKYIDNCMMHEILTWLVEFTTAIAITAIVIVFVIIISASALK